MSDTPKTGAKANGEMYHWRKRHDTRTSGGTG